MANHSLTSISGGVAGSAGAAGTGGFTITFPAIQQKKLGGYLYIQMSGTSNLTLIPSVINRKLGTAQYNIGFGTAGVFGSAGTASIVIGPGTWNSRIALPLIPNETTLIVNAAFGAGTGGVAIVDYTAEGEEQ